MNIILLGAPGAGKGTQADIISQKLSIPIIGTGNIIREAIKSGSPLGEEFQSYTQSGRLVPDDLVVAMVADRLARPDCQNGYILDGFPRTVVQAERFEEMGGQTDCVINLVISDEQATARLTGRRVCPACGAAFHVVLHPPTRENVCDRCGAALETRDDDLPETVIKRLRVYHEQTQPLEAYYKAKGLVTDICATEDRDDITRCILEAIEAV